MMAEPQLVASGKVVETRDNLIVVRAGTTEHNVEGKFDVGLGQVVELYDDGSHKIVGQPPPEPETITAPMGDKIENPTPAPEPTFEESGRRFAHCVVSALELLVGALAHMQAVMPQVAGLAPTIAAMRAHVHEARMLMKEPEPPVEYVDEPPTVEGITSGGEHTQAPVALDPETFPPGPDHAPVQPERPVAPPPGEPAEPDHSADPPPSEVPAVTEPQPDHS